MKHAAFLVIGLALTVISGAALGWYPARLGGWSYWLDDQIYHEPVAWLVSSPYWPVSAGLAFGLGLVLSFGGYALAARWAIGLGSGTRRHLWGILTVQAVICGWLALQPYLSSQDIFSYAFYAHIEVWYHANPYLAVPRDYPWDPLFSAIFWKDQPSNYGPLWTQVSALGPLLAGSSIGATLLILKAEVILATIGGTPLLWAAMERLRPERRLLGVVLYAWNPLLLIESAEAGHNDAMMAFWLILSIWCWSHQRRTASIGALAGAALVKYTSLMFIPLYLLAWWREGREAPLQILAKSTGVCLIAFVAGFAPFYAGPRTFGIIGFGTNALAYTNSPLELAFRQLRVVLGDSPNVATLPLHYRGYWVGVEPSTILWSAPNPSQATGILMPLNESLLVVEPPGGEWLRVYEPRLGHFGYVQFRQTHPIAAPRPPPASETTAVVLAGANGNPHALASNLILRLASLIIFLPLYLAIAWRVRDSTDLFRACATLLLFYLVIVQGWFWPWYLIWGLPFVALAPETLASRALLMLTATTSVLNAQPNVSPTPVIEWAYEARVVVIDGLPIAIILAIWWQKSGRRAPRILEWTSTAFTRLADLARRRVPGSIGAIAVALLLITGAGASDGPGTPPASASNVIAWQRSYGDAVGAFAAGDYDAAVGSLNQVLAIRPSEVAARRLRLASYLQMRRWAEAIPDATRLLAEDPSNTDLRMERGTLFLQVQRADRAVEDFHTVMAIAPDNPAGYQGAGMAAFQQGKLDLASDMLWQALFLAPNDPEIVQQLADVLASKGDLTLALRFYDQAVRLKPTDATIYAGRAALRRYGGLTDSTVPDLRQVLVLSGDLQQYQWAAQLLTSLSHGAGAPINGARSQPGDQPLSR